MKTKSTFLKTLLVVIAAGISAVAAAQCQAGYTASVSGPTASFTNTSVYTGYPVYSWNFGDNTYSNNANPAHQYQAAGSYVVCLTMYDSLNFTGCSSSFCDTLVITAGCNNFSVSATSTNASACNACDGTAAGTLTGGTAPFSYAWSNNVTTQSQSGLCAGYYTLFATDANGCNASATAYVSCPQTCNASFQANPSGNFYYFLNTSNDTMTASFVWDFGDGNYAYTTSASHTYATSGMYAVTLTMTDSVNMCSDTFIDTVYVGNTLACGVGFQMMQDSFNLLQWYAFPTVSGTAPFTYLWDFGDNTTSTQQYPTHTYTVPGQYTVCLSITDATNCTSTFCDSSSVHRVHSASVQSQQMQYFTALSGPLGISEHSNEVTLHAAPNPASDELLITMTAPVDGNIRITDLTGKVVAEQKINGQQSRIDVSTLPVGCYSLSVVSGASTWNQRVVIVR